MRRIHIKRSRRGLLGVGALVLVMCGVFYYNTQVLNAKVQSKKEEIVALEKNKNTLLGKKQSLKDGLVLTEEDIVQIAREKLNLAYPGDLVFKSNK